MARFDDEVPTAAKATPPLETSERLRAVSEAADRLAGASQRFHDARAEFTDALEAYRAAISTTHSAAESDELWS